MDAAAPDSPPRHRIAQESPAQPEVRALIEALDAYQRSLYPAESNHLLDLDSLLQPQVLFAVARDDAGRAVGCAALVRQERAAELKRMVVHPERRGRGTGHALMGWLSAQALREGLRSLQLETGIHQHAAIALYERHGFRTRGPFGDYRPDPLSVFMEKPLPAVSIAALPADLDADADAADDAVEGLATLLQACVLDGASVGFVRPCPLDEARAFWRGLLPAVRSGARRLWIARQDGRVVATVSLVLDTLPNGRHRAEVSKLLVHPEARRHGVARALMLEAEAHARTLGKRLLVLDTRSGDAAERLYLSLGYELAGRVPDFARAPDDARLDATSILYRRLPA